MARPTVRTPETDDKIFQAAAFGCTNEEIAFYADIARTTLYRWLDEDPELKNRIEELKEKPVLLARQTIVKSLVNPEDAKWYLSRKRKKEFSERVETDITTNDKDVSPSVDVMKMAEEIANRLKESKTS